MLRQARGAPALGCVICAGRIDRALVEGDFARRCHGQAEKAGIIRAPVWACASMSEAHQFGIGLVDRGGGMHFHVMISSRRAGFATAAGLICVAAAWPMPLRAQLTEAKLRKCTCRAQARAGPDRNVRQNVTRGVRDGSMETRSIVMQMRKPCTEGVCVFLRQ